MPLKRKNTFQQIVRMLCSKSSHYINAHFETMSDCVRNGKEEKTEEEKSIDNGGWWHQRVSF